MYCWRPNFGNQFDELFDILKNGFRDPIEYKKHGYEEAIPFSNSMSVSDYHRIDAIKSNQNSKSSNFAFKHGNYEFYRKAEIIFILHKNHFCFRKI